VFYLPFGRDDRARPGIDIAGRQQPMLVLTRKTTERLYIGDDICVTVVRLEGRQVRLGIEAPRHVTVRRGELPPRPAEPVVGERTPVMPPTDELRGTGIPRRVPSR
jgi:carbon storage regulator